MMLLEFASEAHVRERAYALPASICCLIPYVVILYVPRIFPSQSGESSPYVYSTGLITIKGWLNFTIHGPFFVNGGQVPKPFNPEKEFQKRQLRIREKVAAMQKAAVFPTTMPEMPRMLGLNPVKMGLKYM